MPWPKGVRRGAQIGREPRAANGKTLPARTRVVIVAELFALAHERGVSSTRLAGQVNRDRVTLTRWKHGWSTPDAGDIERMAAALGCRLKLEATNDA